MIALLGMAFTLGVATRVVSLPLTYGHVSVSIPVMSVPPNDPGFHKFTEAPSENIDDRAPVVVLTHEALYFGDVASFGRDLAETRNKFVVPHDDGSPRLDELATAFASWAQENGRYTRPIPLVLAPAGDIPMPIVIQTIAGLKQIPLVERVVLAGGIF